MNAGNFFTSFGGRLNRAKYWLFFLLWIGPGVGTLQIVGDLGTLMAFLVLVVSLAIFSAWLAACVMRLHDRDYSGWMILFFVFLPVAIQILVSIGTQYIAKEIAFIGIFPVLISGAIGLWGFVELACLRGTVGPNRFGPDPLGGAETGPTATA